MLASHAPAAKAPVRDKEPMSRTTQSPRLMELVRSRKLPRVAARKTNMKESEAAVFADQ
jgi:hypothetical protein